MTRLSSPWSPNPKDFRNALSPRTYAPQICRSCGKPYQHSCPHCDPVPEDA